jgi:hypothetical protein
MLRRSSYIVAAASVAAQAGPAAVLLCDDLVKEMRSVPAAPSEREIILARAAAAAARAGNGTPGPSRRRMPHVNWRGIVTGLGLRKPRLAA